MESLGPTNNAPPTTMAKQEPADTSAGDQNLAALLSAIARLTVQVSGAIRISLPKSLLTERIELQNQVQAITHNPEYSRPAGTFAQTSASIHGAAPPFNSTPTLPTAPAPSPPPAVSSPAPPVVQYPALSGILPQPPAIHTRPSSHTEENQTAQRWYCVTRGREIGAFQGW
jgi:hypothetical protein